MWFAVLILVAGLVPPSLVSAADLTFTPVADAHVNSGSPSANYGGLTSMKVREGSGSSADPAYRGYWRFAVTGLTGAPASVKLRLFVTDASANSLGVYPIANTTWTETGLTYSNAPPITGSPLVSRTTPVANAYVEFALPASAVVGNGPVAFAIKSAGTDSAVFATREVGGTPPQLVVTPNAGPPPPVAEFTGSPTSGPVGQSVTFDSSASQGSGLTYAWSFGDGTTPPEASQANPVHQYTSAGTYAVALTVSNANGSNTRTRPGYITIGDPPVASFTATPGSGTAPLTVAFDASGSTGANLTYAWNFGDPGSGTANTSTLQKPTHTYAAGSYQVALSVSNANGTSAAPPATISVAPPASGGSIVVAPAADAQVYGSSVNTNYGSLATIRTRENGGTSGTYRSYLKFVVAGTGGSVTAVKLRLFVTDETPNAQGIYSVSNTTWTETGLTWTNAPPIAGTPLVSGPAPTANAYVEFNLPVTAIPGDGTYTFAIKGTSTNSAIFRSKEATANRPQLVVTLGGAPPVGVPTAAFTSDRSTGQAPLAVQFTDQSTNGANGWSWDFGEPSSGPRTSRPRATRRTSTRPSGPTPSRWWPRTSTARAHRPPERSPSIRPRRATRSWSAPATSPTAPSRRTRRPDAAGRHRRARSSPPATTPTRTAPPPSSPTATARRGAPQGPDAAGRRQPRVHTAGRRAVLRLLRRRGRRPDEGLLRYDIGSWHAVVLNSNCTIVGGCGRVAAGDSGCEPTWPRQPGDRARWRSGTTPGSAPASRQ